jgi:hypothetical protein
VTDGFYNTGGLGFLFGGAVGIIRGLPTFLSAAATSLQTFGLGATFTATRAGIIEAWTTEQHVPTPRELTTATALAGGLSGGMTGLIFRGRRNVIPGAIMWTIFGASGQYLYNRWASSPRQVDTAGPNFWQRMSDKSWTPFKVLTNEEYAAMLREKMLKVEVEISILDDKMTALKEQQKNEESQVRPNSEK